jgi:hypothetical protein
MANKTTVIFVFRYKDGVISGLSRNITLPTARLRKRIKATSGGEKITRLFNRLLEAHLYFRRLLVLLAFCNIGFTTARVQKFLCLNQFLLIFH